MGFGAHFAYESSEQIFDEIRRFANPKTGYDLRGVHHELWIQSPDTLRRKLAERPVDRQLGIVVPGEPEHPAARGGQRGDGRRPCLGSRLRGGRRPCGAPRAIPRDSNASRDRARQR